MKNIFLILSLLISQGVSAQDSLTKQFPDYRHELCIGYGILSSDKILDGQQIGRPSSYKVKNYSGAISFTYRYSILSWFSAGIALAYENETGIWQQSEEQGIGEWNTYPIGSFKRMAFTIAPEFSFIYRRDENGLVKCYVFCAAGLTYQNEVDVYDMTYYNTHYQNGINSLGNNQQIENNRVHFNGQLSPACISVGRRVNGFLEIGIGYKGVFACGLTVKL